MRLNAWRTCVEAAARIVLPPWRQKAQKEGAPAVRRGDGLGRNPMPALLARLASLGRPPGVALPAQGTRARPALNAAAGLPPAEWKANEVCWQKLSLPMEAVFEPEPVAAVRKGHIDGYEDHGRFVIVRPDKSRPQWLYAHRNEPCDRVDVIKVVGVDDDRLAAFLQKLEAVGVLVPGLHRHLLSLPNEALGRPPVTPA